MDPRSASSAFFDRRKVLVLGASAVAAAVGGALFGPASPAAAAVSPRLPGEVGRVNNQVSRYAGTVYDHIRLLIGGDSTRLFIPQGIVPGSTKVPVLWLYHASGSSDDALTSGFKQMGERAVDLGMIAVCQNLGGTLYTSPAAKQHQINSWKHLSGIYGINRNFLRATSHGGAMATEVIATGLMPNVVGAYIVNGVYDIENLYRNGSAEQKDRIAAAFGNDSNAIRAHNPARHAGTAFAGKRLRVTYSQPDSSDPTVPPQYHAKPLIALAAPLATEASFRIHSSGHGTPSFADAESQATFQRWTTETAVPVPAAPKLVAQWGFAEAAAPFASAVAGAPALLEGPGSAAKRVPTPFGGGVQLNGSTDYLGVLRANLGPLNIGATTGAVTVAAWVFSTDTNNAMIAGCWQENTAGGERSYALFNDLPTFGGNDMVCMHVSKNGGATPGYKFSIDYAAEPRPITRSRWQLHVGTYDGTQAVAYLDGVATSYPSYTDSNGATYAKNPYAYPQGLNATPTDFLVGAVIRDGTRINLHKGMIARLRVWNGALTTTQVRALYDSEKGVLA
jgi:hypothetical protein